jgi:hypothetical protein
MNESTTDVEVATIEENSFVRDQQSLQSPMGLMMTLGMVAVALTLCGAALYFGI